MNTGRKETVITSSEKKMLGPTSCIAPTSTGAGARRRCPASCQASSLLWMFSMMMIEASTMAPMATAMPPSDMMLMVRPW